MKSKAAALPWFALDLLRNSTPICDFLENLEFDAERLIVIGDFLSSTQPRGA